MVQRLLEQMLQWGLHDPKAAGLILMGIAILVLVLAFRRDRRGFGIFIKCLGPDRLAKMAAEARKAQLEAIEASRKRVRGLDAQLRQEQGDLGLLCAETRRFRGTVRRLGLTEAPSQEG